MTPETIFRRLSKIARENIKAFGSEEWERRCEYWKGALGESRGTVKTSEEFLLEIRDLRRKYLREEKSK